MLTLQCRTAPSCATARTRTRRRRSTSTRRRPTRPVGGARRGAAGQGALVQQHRRSRRGAAGWCSSSSEPAVAIVKHTNPCGVAGRRRRARRRTELARECDPVSAFGGIVALNREVDDDARRELSRDVPRVRDRARLHRRRRATALAKKKSCACSRTGRRRTGERALACCARSPAACWCRRATIASCRRREAQGRRRSARRRREELRALEFAWRVVQAREVERDRVRRCTTGGVPPSASAPGR